MKKTLLYCSWLLLPFCATAQTEDKKPEYSVADSLELENVVVTGYQKIDKRYTTSSVTTVKMEDLQLPGFSSIDQMMEGKIPDLVLSTNSGEVMATPRLRIRGTSTLNGNKEPLYVIDASTC